MRLSIEISHTGTEKQLPEAIMSFQSKPNAEVQVQRYYRQQEELWSTSMGWPLGREITATTEWLYKQAIHEENNA